MIFNMKRSIEPGLLRIFRYFAAVSTIYFSVLLLSSVFIAGKNESLQFAFWGNTVVYLGLFIYLNSPQLEKRLKSLYLPVALIIASFFPIVGNFAHLANLGQVNLYVIINQSWLWLPIIVVPIILIAWQYNFTAVMAYIICSNGLELLVLLSVVGKVTTGNINIISVPLLRAFAFGIVGFIVNTMANTQRMQTHKLIQANFRLNQYLNTLEELTASRERNRLASELHDTLAHTLSGLSINLEAIKTVVSPENSEAQKMLDDSLVITRSGLDETRRVLKALRAGPLEDVGLVKGLENLVQDASLRGSIPIDLKCPEQTPVLPLDVEQCIYRIVQESLENILRHANATSADVTLSISNALVELTIHDSGSGFILEFIEQDEQFGLRGIQERAAAVGGTLAVQSQPGMGTTIHFVWERFQ